jgi:adenine-specific DNA methylase
LSTNDLDVRIVGRIAAPLNDLAQSWQASSLGSESTLHQLAPYIGKLKSSLAASLIENYSQKKDTIIDPFCGSGVVPLEALLRQ